VIKGKMELLTNFKWILKISIPNGGNVAKRNSKSMQFFFLEIVKFEPPNKVQCSFSKRDAFNAHKTSIFISFTSLIRME
jgi:hypothetical protein